MRTLSIRPLLHILAAAAVLAAVCSGTSPLRAQSFSGLGTIEGMEAHAVYEAVDLSDDGSTIVGNVNAQPNTRQYRPFRWVNGAFEWLEYPTTDQALLASAVSADGRVVVGYPLTGTIEAVEWRDGVFSRLGDFPEGDFGSGAYDVSADGSVIVGWGISGPGSGWRHAARWANGAIHELFDVQGADFFTSRAFAVSADGSVIVGELHIRSGPACCLHEAFRVDETGEVQTLGVIGSGTGSPVSSASGVSGDGRVVVGQSTSDIGIQAFRWTAEDGMQGLGILPGASSSRAIDVSADGAVVVGNSGNSAFIWTDSAGMRSIKEVLEAAGVDVDGWVLSAAAGISADGTTVSGSGVNPDGHSELWIAQLYPNDLIVNSTGDRPDLDPADEVCNTGELVEVDGELEPECTLRAAIQEANARPGADEIAFDLDASGGYIITPTEPLPSIAEAVTIDGTTQPGTSLIHLRGTEAGGSGLMVDADNVTIRGLILTGFAGHGIHVRDGDNGVLEALIIGTDVAGSEGIGNGGDGIHISGGSGWRVGGNPEAGGTSALDLSVTLAGNGQNGLFAGSESNATLIRAGKAGAIAAPTLTGLTLSNLIVGMVDAPDVPIGLPNGRDGIRLEGVLGADLDLIRVSHAVENAVSVIASQAINVRRANTGLLRPNPQSVEHVGSIGGSIFRIVESIGVTVGSDSPDDSPVQGGAAAGWFVQIEESENVQIRNLLGGITENVSTMSERARQAMRNLSGGMWVSDSPNVSVGAPSVRTIFANNGGDASKPQAGLFARGRRTEGLRVQNTIFGTTPDGLSGIGNAGSGLVLSDIGTAELGGDSEEERLISAGNGKFGFLFENLELPDPDPSDESSPLVQASRLVSDFVENAQGKMMKLSNGESGFRLTRMQRLLIKMLSVGPSALHGIDIVDSEGITIESASIGSMFQKPLQSADDVSAPEGHGISISGSADIAIGSVVDNATAVMRDVFINGVGGNAIAAVRSQGLSFRGIAIGLAPEGSSDVPELIDALGSSMEAMLVRLSNDVEIVGSTFLGNGTSSMSGAGGLFIDQSAFVRLMQNQFGHFNNDHQPARSNVGAAIRASLVRKMAASANKMVGHDRGMLLENTDASLKANTFMDGGWFGGAGRGVEATAGSIVDAARNMFIDNKGAALWFSEDSGGLIRHNDIAGNGEGVVAEVTGNKIGQSAGRVLAPDNWWGDSSGPGGAGPGIGDAISEGVEASTWLGSPLGIIVEPESRIVKAAALTDVIIPVTFASPLVGADVLDVTVSDERGWVTSETTFEVSVPTFGSATRVIEATLFQAGINTVTVSAVSQTDPSLVGEALVVIGIPRRFSSIESDAEAGSAVVDADADEVFVVGGEVILNPGAANEERATIAGFGSILLAAPLRFDHSAGEPIAPANRFAVGRGEDPGSALPSDLDLVAYPNPATATINLSLDLPRTERVRIALYDIVGRRIGVLQDGSLSAGRHNLTLDVSSLPSGMYLTRLTASDRIVTRTLVVAH